MEQHEADNTSPKPVSSPERSPFRGLKTLRRPKLGDEASTLSVSNADNGRGSLLRRSVDKGSRRLSGTPRSAASSEDGRRSSAGSVSPTRRISKFMRRRKKDRNTADVAGDTAATGLGLTHANTTDGTSPEFDGWNNASSESVGQTKSIDSSLLTDDSEPEALTRPPLDSRPSHTGLLTLSSPLITAETVDPSQPPLLPEKIGIDGNALAPVQSADTIVQTSSPHPALDSQNLVSPQQQQQQQQQQDKDTSTSPWNALFGPAPKTEASTSPAINAARAAHKLSLQTQTSIEVPSTVVTPATPVLDTSPRFTTLRNRDSPKLGSLPSATHRRVKSAAPGPSRLSTAAVPALTTAVEEVKTPGGSLTQPNNAAGFFSSFLGATQNASNQLSNFFNNNPTPPHNRSLSNQEKTGPTGSEEVILSDAQLAKTSKQDQAVPSEPAVATLGSGSLTLDHLGISEPTSDASMTSKEELSDEIVASPTTMQDAAPFSKTEEAAAAEAVAAAYTDKPVVPLDKKGRPLSVSSGGPIENGLATPPQSIVNGKEGSFGRNNSVRSRLSDRARHRQRKGSTATGSQSTIAATMGPSGSQGALAAAIGATHSALANPAKGRLTGFALANQKRNKDFHGFFKSVPEDDFLIEDYSAALQREILLHGRLYISEKNVCFSSNIMGYITTLVISFDEIMAMEKKNTAMIFPNAIVIQTLHAKNTFASLLNRDATYDLLLAIWKIKHPNLKETELGHKLDNTMPVAKVETPGSGELSDDDSEGESEEEDDEVGSLAEAEGRSVGGSDVGEPTKVVPMRAVSGANGSVMVPATNGTAIKASALDTTGPTSAAGDFPGPATHAPTDCSDSATHFEKPVLDDTVPAPLGQVYSLMFGPLSGVFMRKFLENYDSTDIEIEDDKRGMGEMVKTSSYSYIKKLSGAIGPKQTKCIIDQNMDSFDLEKAVSVTCSTQTPDVPSGNVFVTKTRYCLMWGPGNSTRILMSSGVEWSGKSWIKGPIEKGCEAGQAQHGKDLTAFMRVHLAVKSPIKGIKTKTKGKRKKTMESLDSSTAAVPIKVLPVKAADWGILEPLHPILGPVADMLGPLGNITTILTMLLLVVSILWLRSPSRGTLSQGSFMPPQRLAAYEEMWRKEESELWNWLDDRLRLDEVYTAGRNPTEEVVRSRRFGSTQEMSQRQVDEAIRVTEEKLASLKGVIGRRKDERGKDEL